MSDAMVDHSNGNDDNVRHVLSTQRKTSVTSLADISKSEGNSLVEYSPCSIPSNWSDVGLTFNTPTRGMTGIDDSLPMSNFFILGLQTETCHYDPQDDHSFHQMSSVAYSSQMNSVVGGYSVGTPTSREIMTPDSQMEAGGLSSRMHHLIFPEDIKHEMSSSTSSGVHSSISSASNAIPTSIAYPGTYGFEIAFEQQCKETKSITWTYSRSLKKLFVRMGSTCPIRFRCHLTPPPGSWIRATPVYMKPEHVQEVVTRCPNHAAPTKEDNHPAPSHLVRCEHNRAKYITDTHSKRESVAVPHEQPQAGAEWVTNLYQFMCFSSCVGGLGRRPVQVIFTLENEGEIHGRQSVEVRICACPGRDRRTEECVEAAEKKTVLKSNHGGGDVSPIPSKIRKPNLLDTEDGEEEEEEDKFFTLTIHGRENYQLLNRLNEALQLAGLFSQLKDESSRPSFVEFTDEAPSNAADGKSNCHSGASKKLNNSNLLNRNSFQTTNTKPAAKSVFKRPADVFQN